MRNFVNLQRDGEFGIGLKGSSSNPYPTTTTSNTSSSGSNGSGSGSGWSIWDTIFGNIGSIGTGAASVITAIGNNRNNKILAENSGGMFGNYGNYSQGTGNNNTMIWIIAIVLILVMLGFGFMVMRKAG